MSLLNAEVRKQVQDEFAALTDSGQAGLSLRRTWPVLHEIMQLIEEVATTPDKRCGGPLISQDKAAWPIVHGIDKIPGCGDCG